jgi:membrane associated rhomboid family serine protease
MLLDTFRFIALVLAALALTMESAHVLELPQKLQYSAEMYAAVNSTLYRYFAIVGSAYQIGAVLAAGLLAFFLRRHRRVYRWTLAGAVLLLLAFVTWCSVVAPVNSEIEQATLMDPDSVAQLWMGLRNRWEYGHAAGFVLQLAGFCALVISLLIDRPAGARGASGPGDGR